MTVGLVIVSHSTQLAAGVAELAGQMTQGKTPITLAGGAVDNILGTSADKILAAIQAVDGPTDLLETQLIMTNPTGLHARPDSLFVQTAGRFAAQIEASGHGRQTDATSI